MTDYLPDMLGVEVGSPEQDHLRYALAVLERHMTHGRGIPLPRSHPPARGADWGSSRMTHALVRFALAFDPRIANDPSLGRNLMVQRGALEKLRSDRAIPVLVDHNPARKVGTVHEIYVAPDVVSGSVVREFYFASVELDDPPGWLKVGGAVSWAHTALRTQDVNGTTRLLRGLIHEISILAPATKPAEPLARVSGLWEKRSAAAGENTPTGAVLGRQATIARTQRGHLAHISIPRPRGPQERAAGHQLVPSSRRTVHTRRSNK